MNLKSAVSGWFQGFHKFDLVVPVIKFGSLKDETTHIISKKHQLMVDIINICQISLWTILTLNLLPEAGHFLYDEAYYYNESLRIARGQLFPALGPFISGTDPTAFTPGAGLYLLYAPAFFFSSHPAAAVIWLICLSAIGLLIFDRMLRKCGAEPIFRLLVITLGTWGFWHFKMSDRMWNVNLYWFTNLSLLSLTMLAAHRNRISLTQCILFGVLAAFAMQIHIGGALAVAVCGLIIMRHCFSSLLKQSPWMAGAFFSMYVPYLIYDGIEGFANTKLLGNTIPHDYFSKDAVAEAFKAVGVYGSHLDRISFLRKFPDSYFYEGLTFYACLFLTAITLFTKHLFRMMTVIMTFILPVYFILNHRNYSSLYAAPLIPYAAVLPALGLTVLYKSFRVGKVVAIAYASFFAFSGYNLTTKHFKNASNTIEHWISRTKSVLNRPTPLPLKEKSADYFIYWVIASNYLGRELIFDHKDQHCSVTFHRPAENIMVFDKDHPSYFTCRATPISNGKDKVTSQNDSNQLQLQ